MADPNDPNQQNTTSNTAGSNQYGANTPGSSAGTPGASTTAGPGTAAPTTPGTTNSQYNQARQQKGTGFTNIQQILNANQGYGQRIGQQIGSGLQNQATGVNNSIKTGQDQFNTAATGNYNAANAGIQAGQNLTQQAGESADTYANRIAGGNTDYSAIGQGIQNAQYTGPNALSNAGQIQSQAATASALGRLAGTTGGQDQLLANMVAKRGNYTQGDTSLDQLLLGKGGEQYVQQGAQGLSNIGNTANNAIAGAQNQATNYGNAIDTNKQATLAALQNQLSGAGDATSNGITGFTTLAQKQGTDYNTNVSRLGQLLSGKDSSGNAIDMTNLSGTDRDLLSHLSDYGLGDASVYQHNGPDQEVSDANANGLTNSNNVVGNNQNYIDAALQTLGSNLNLSQGGSYYKGNQGQAAQNLASVLGQSDIKNSIANNKFNTNNFDPTSAFSGLAAEKTGDQAAQGFYNNQAALGGNIQDVLKQKQDTLNNFASANNTTPEQLNAAISKINSGNPIDPSDPSYQLAQKYFNSSDYNNAQTAQANLARQLAGYAGIAGTQADNGSISQYAQNLSPELVSLSQNPKYQYYTGNGLASVNDPNAWRNSSYFSDLGKQSVGQDTSLQNYVLKNLLKSGGATS